MTLLKNMPRATIVTLLVFALLIVVALIRQFSPYAGDWHLTYYPATRSFLNGQTPYYQGSLLENPIWVCIILAPLALFSEPTRRALLLVASIGAYLAAFQRPGLPRFWIIFIFLSPQVLYGINMGTIDGLDLAAPILPP